MSAKVFATSDPRQETPMTDRLNQPADESSLLRSDERARVREELEARLSASGVKLTGSESDEQIITLSDAVEFFEAARERLGVDSMVNTPESSQPDDERFVLPVRRDDESVDRYVTRIRASTRRLADDG